MEESPLIASVLGWDAEERGSLQALGASVNLAEGICRGALSQELLKDCVI